MHVASYPNLLNPFFAYNFHTMIPPLPMRTKLHSYDLTPLKAHIVRLRRACSGSHPHIADGNSLSTLTDYSSNPCRS